MKSKKDKSFRKASRGTALVLAAAASASVVLSVLLLFGYVSKVSERQKTMENAAQARLSHDAAVEYAAFMYASGRISPDDFVPPVEIGGMMSQFRIIESLPLESRTLRYEFPGISELSAVPSRSGLLVAGTANDSVVVYLREIDTDGDRTGFPLTICSVPDNWILEGCVPDIEPLSVIACDNDSVDVLIAIFGDGTSSTYSLGEFEISAFSIVTTGFTEWGPVVVISDGFNAGIAIELDGGEIRHLYSASGTCPVVMPDGGMYGEMPSDETADYILDTPLISDVFFGDYDLDGKYDAVWASDGCLACMSSARGLLVKDEVESAELIAWGYIEGRYGLGGLWKYEGSEISWRKYLINGFQNLDNCNASLERYNGRIYSYQSTLTGIRSGNIEIVDSDFSDQIIITIENGIPQNFNGSGGIDIAVISEETILLYLDPAGSEDALVELEIATGLPGENPVLESVYTFKICFPNRDRLITVTPEGGIRG